MFAWGGGTVTPAPGVYTYDEGTVVTLTAAPAGDATFTGWSGAASGKTLTTTVTVEGDALVGARFFDPTVTSTLPAPETGPVEAPSGTAGNLQVLDWAGFAAAFSYTFDDARSSQSWDDNYATMNAEGIPMTFYVIPSEVDKTPERLAFWQSVAADGHEMGNHTLNHCNVTAAGDLSGCAYGALAADATAMQQIDDASAWIEENLGVDGVFTMATPYGNGNWAPFGEAAGFIGVRSINAGVMAPNDLSKQFALSDSFMGTDYGGKGETAADMEAQIDSARDAGAWTTALVHKWIPAAEPADAGDQCCQMAVTDMVASMEYLKDLGDVWADTVVAVASYWIGQDILSSATPTTSGDTTTWTWTLPPNFPPGKFVRVTVDGGVLSQGGVDLTWDEHGYYEVALDAGELTLSAAAAPTGEDCILVSGSAQSHYGETGISVQFPLTGATDFTTANYTATVDVFVPASSAQATSETIQLPNAGYAASYFGKWTTLQTDQWQTLTFDLSATTYGDLLADSTNARFLFGTAAEGDAITFCLKNFQITNGTTTPLDFQVAAGGNYSGLYVPTGTDVTITTVKR